ncbi:MAG: AAA family ATPase [Bacteroidales bacterium]|jgi:exodeoxyribonuclease-5|nr:AAA family ATPase [Bacteroidales bacterium]MCK9499889.1 AAA family ATPase [Bacteroidales bacterium]MDY0315292.1 AAA family ATPase [Bacteroidales bacterium]NLB87414.1 AAA family ATPase [Bacteroidales bacterium]
MIGNFLNKQVLEGIDHIPTQDQALAINELNNFLTSKEKHCVFLLTGFAGTGKTTLISALINALNKNKIKTVLMAPTGRAAKVLSSYSKKPAFTIHKCIYRKKSSKNSDNKFNLNFNNHKDTIFIVDEASMISNQDFSESIFGSGRLLDDLFAFVYNDNNCRLILVGDSAQLPPVGTNLSPALDYNYIEAYGFQVYKSNLSEVVRQDQDSGILENASNLRLNLESKNISLPKLKTSLPDVEYITGSDLLEELESSYSKYGEDETKIICRSNKTALQYNLGIRNRILWRDEEISQGDQIMVVKNNYSWLAENEKIDFIANGDILEVKRIGRTQEIYGHKYIDLSLQFVDYPEIEIDAKAILDSLHSEKAAMDNDYYKNLYQLLQEDYSEISDSKKRQEKILEDPFFNALQVKFAYAVTCHKAQGGQWKSVFIDHGYINFDELSEEGIYALNRWLYTAITRASEKVYLVNFAKQFLNG